MSKRVLPPDRVTLERITEDCVALYCQVPPPGENSSISVEPLEVEDLVPMEDEIEWEVLTEYRIVYETRVMYG